MNLHLLLRIKRLIQNPPSWQRVVLGAGAIAVCLVIVGIEALGWWPEALTATRARMPTVVPAP